MSDKPLSLGGGPLNVERSTFSPAYSIVGTLIIFAFFTAAPWILAASWVSVLSNFFILVIMATMWNLLAGYAGMVSIGQQGFVGLGAYALLYFAIKGMSPFVAIPVAMIACAILAYPITFLLFRLRGGYFAVATWVIADSAMLVILSIALLGGGTGKYLPGLSNLSPSQLDHDTYLATWFVAFAVVVATYFILRSRLGLVLSSMRDNETAARSAGAKVTSTRRLIYVIAAAGCGAAGAVLAISQPFIQPGNEFSLNWAAEMLFVSMIGGLGTIEGPIIGCVIFFALQQWLQNLGAWYLIIFGSVAVVIALWLPRGIWGAIRERTHFELLPVGYRVSTRKPRGKVVTARDVEAVD
ncbi:MAG: branched-chain amino acid ABC transporter permease [Acidimicrobiales bacterium]